MKFDYVKFRDRLIVFTVLFPIIGFYFENLPASIFSYLPVAIINLYVFLSLLVAALKSDGLIDNSKHMITRILPKKAFGLLMFFAAYWSLIFAFARIYKSSGEQIENLKTSFDSFYFSFQVITTMSNGEYKPLTEFTQSLVMWEFGSALLLMTGGFGLLMSRLANYK